MNPGNGLFVLLLVAATTVAQEPMNGMTPELHPPFMSWETELVVTISGVVSFVIAVALAITLCSRKCTDERDHLSSQVIHYGSIQAQARPSDVVYFSPFRPDQRELMNPGVPAYYGALQETGKE